MQAVYFIDMIYNRARPWGHYSYFPRYSLLSNHWLVFHFLAEEDLQKILVHPWILSQGVLMIKHWQPGFNPLMETFLSRFLWIIFPDFQLEIWSTCIFMDIENSVGIFVYFDK